MSAQPHAVNPLSAVGNNRRLVLEALVQISEPATRDRIASVAGITADAAGVQLVGMVNSGAVSRVDQPKGRAALWCLAVSIGTARQMLAAMSSTAAPAATDGSPGEDQDDTQAQAEPERPGVEDTEESLARRQIDLAHELMALGHRPDSLGDPDDFGDDEDAGPESAPDALPRNLDATDSGGRIDSLLAIARSQTDRARELLEDDTVTIVSDADVRADWIERHTGPKPEDGSIYSALLTASTVHDSAAVVAEQQAAELLARAAEARTVASRIVGLSDALRGLSLDTAVLVLDRARAALGRA